MEERWVVVAEACARPSQGRQPIRAEAGDVSRRLRSGPLGGQDATRPQSTEPLGGVAEMLWRKPCKPIQKAAAGSGREGPVKLSQCAGSSGHVGGVL